MVWNYENADCSLKINLLRHLLKVSAHFRDDGGGYDLRGHNLKVKVQRSRLQLRQGFFGQGVVCVWNSLPSSVVEASSVNVFK